MALTPFGIHRMSCRLNLAVARRTGFWRFTDCSMIGEKGDPGTRIPAGSLMFDDLGSSDGHAQRELMVWEGWSGSSSSRGPGISSPGRVMTGRSIMGRGCRNDWERLNRADAGFGLWQVCGLALWCCGGCDPGFRPTEMVRTGSWLDLESADALKELDPPG